MAFSFRRLAAGALLFSASGGILYAILPIFELQEGGGPLLATLVIAVPLLAQTLATPLWGSLSDRWGRRRELLAFGVLAQSALFLAYPFLSPVELLGIRVLQVFLGATSNLALAVVTEDPQRTAGRGLGGLYLWNGVGTLLGIVAGFPFVTGTSFRASSPQAVLLFVLLAGLSAASVVVLLLAGELPRRPARTGPREWFTFRSGPWVWRLSAASAVVGVANYTVFTLFPVYVDRVLAPGGLAGLSLNATQQLALLSIGAAVGGILVSPWAGGLADTSRSRRRLFLTTPMVYALLWTGLAEIHSYPVVFLIWAYPASNTFAIPLAREVAGLTSPEERGRAVGLLTSAYTFGGLGGAALAGYGAAQGWGFSTLFLTGAALDLVGCALLVGVLRWGGGVPAPNLTVQATGSETV